MEQEQQVTPEPKEEEPIKELPVEEAYQCSVLIENRRYDMEARFFPQCGMCRITSMQGDTEITLYEGPYTEEDGMYTIDMNGETVCLRLGEGSLTVEKGALIAYSCFVWNEEAQQFENAGSVESVRCEAGVEFDVSSNSVCLRDGVYIFDASEDAYSFNEVLLNVDLMQRSFALRCFDGSVVTGVFDFEYSYGTCNLICRYDDGAVAFSVGRTVVYDEAQNCTEIATLSETFSDTVVYGALLYYPQPDGVYNYRFYHTLERTDQIAADAATVPLDSYKERIAEGYSFTQAVADDNTDQYILDIYHSFLMDTWESQSEWKGVSLKATENSDGTITLSSGKRKWSFHRENNGLVFDGGSALVVNNWPTEGETRYEKELQPGAFFAPTDAFRYIYNTVYVAPETDGGYSAALYIDWENQRIRVADKFGWRYEGLFTKNAYGLDSSSDTVGVQVYIDGHTLDVSKYSVLDPGSDPQEIWFIPTHATENVLAMLGISDPTVSG